MGGVLFVHVGWDGNLDAPGGVEVTVAGTRPKSEMLLAFKVLCPMGRVLEKNASLTTAGHRGRLKDFTTKDTKAVLRNAGEDGFICRNAWRIRGGGDRCGSPSLRSG